jgi:hypothetical protein
VRTSILFFWFFIKERGNRTKRSHRLLVRRHANSSLLLASPNETQICSEISFAHPSLEFRCHPQRPVHPAGYTAFFFFHSFPSLPSRRLHVAVRTSAQQHGYAWRRDGERRAKNPASWMVLLFLSEDDDIGPFILCNVRG